MRRNPLVPTIDVDLYLKGKAAKFVIAFDALGGYNFTKYFDEEGDDLDTRNPAIIIRCFADPPIPEDVTDREILQGLPLTAALKFPKEPPNILPPKTAAGRAQTLHGRRGNWGGGLPPTRSLRLHQFRLVGPTVLAKRRGRPRTRSPPQGVGAQGPARQRAGWHRHPQQNNSARRRLDSPREGASQSSRLRGSVGHGNPKPPNQNRRGHDGRSAKAARSDTSV